MKLIIRKDKIFTHIGIYLDYTRIFHFSSISNCFFRNDKVVKCNNLVEFSRNREIRLIDLKSELFIEDFVSATKAFAEKQENYHIIRNNCYTFVLWCLYGKRGTSIKDILFFAHNYNIPIFSFGIWDIQ